LSLPGESAFGFQRLEREGSVFVLSRT